MVQKDLLSWCMTSASIDLVKSSVSLHNYVCMYRVKGLITMVMQFMFVVCQHVVDL